GGGGQQAGLPGEGDDVRPLLGAGRQAVVRLRLPARRRPPLLRRRVPQDRRDAAALTGRRESPHAEPQRRRATQREERGGKGKGVHRLLSFFFTLSFSSSFLCASAALREGFLSCPARERSER